jgi:hypothetical protein
MNGFVSLRTVQDSLAKLAGEACSEAEFYEILSNHAEFIVVRDSMIQGVITEPFYRLICNRDKIFAINGKFYRVNEHEVEATAAESYTEALSRFASKQIEFVFPYRVREVRSSSGCPNEIFAERTNAGNDRRVQLRVKVYVHLNQYNTCHYVYKQVVLFAIDALRKSWIGNTWYHYETDISYEGLAVQLDERYKGNWFQCYTPGGCYALCNNYVYGRTIEVNIPNATIYDDSNGYHEILQYVGDSIQNTPISTVPLRAAKGRAWTRGTSHDYYAKICCGYECPWP